MDIVRKNEIITRQGLRTLETNIDPLPPFLTICTPDHQRPLYFIPVSPVCKNRQQLVWLFIIRRRRTPLVQGCKCVSAFKIGKFLLAQIAATQKFQSTLFPSLHLTKPYRVHEFSFADISLNSLKNVVISLSGKYFLFAEIRENIRTKIYLLLLTEEQSLIVFLSCYLKF